MFLGLKHFVLITLVITDDNKNNFVICNVILYPTPPQMMSAVRLEEDARADASRIVATAVERVIGRAANEHEPLLDAGLDSLSAAELASALESALDDEGAGKNKFLSLDEKENKI
jgi:acyl carrier protein